MGVHCHRGHRQVKKYPQYRMSTTAPQSVSAAKVIIATNATSKKTASTTNKFKTSYATMIIEAIQELKQKKGSSRQAIMKQIAGKENIIPNALMITKTLKKMIEEGRLVPGAQAGRSGAGSFKLALQEKSRIAKAERVVAKKVKESTSTKKVASKSTTGKKKVVKKGAKKGAKKAAKSSSKSGGSIQKSGKVMKKSAKKVFIKAKKTAAGSKKVKK